MKIETLKDRVQKAEERISKKQNTIVKKEALIAKKTAMMEKVSGEERRWLEFDVENLRDDISRLEKEVNEAKESFEKYNAQLTAEIEKANSRNIPAIVEFIENWKTRMHDYFMNAIREYFAESERVYSLYQKANALRWGTPEYDEAHSVYEEARLALREDVRGKYEMVEMFSKRLNRMVKTEQKVTEGKYEFCAEYLGFKTAEEAEARLISDLTAEGNRKYDFIIERTNEIVGTITDATGLRVGATGELNGFIIGDRGTAKVQTIDAGGYNIQCYHFRTLIHEVRK